MYINNYDVPHLLMRDNTRHPAFGGVKEQCKSLIFSEIVIHNELGN